MPVSWPTWEKVYWRPSASWKASTLPSRNCAPTQDRPFRKPREKSQRKTERGREESARRASSARPCKARFAKELRTLRKPKREYASVAHLHVGVDDELGEAEDLAAEVEGVAEAGLLALLGGERLDGLQ
eukprot:6960952-Pyramimonas_sp.AAC.1